MRQIIFSPEACSALGNSSKSTLKRLIQNPDNGFPDPMMVGGRLAWFIDEIADWLESRPRRKYVSDDVTDGAQGALK
jgi:predicted DNA-binding transcriptional regulator AlpA